MMLLSPTNFSPEQLALCRLKVNTSSWNRCINWIMSCIWCWKIKTTEERRYSTLAGEMSCIFSSWKSFTAAFAVVHFIIQVQYPWISVPWVLVDKRRTILQMKKHTHSERHSKFSVNEQVFLRRKLTQKQIYFSFFLHWSWCSLFKIVFNRN